MFNVYKDVKDNGQYDKDYISGLVNINNLIELRKYLKSWRWIANDAYKQSNKMTEIRFKKFKDSQKKESKNIFTNNRDFMIIQTPNMLFQISAISLNYMIPFGIILNRLISFDKLIISNGIIVDFKRRIKWN